MTYYQISLAIVAFCFGFCVATIFCAFAIHRDLK